MTDFGSLPDRVATRYFATHGFGDSAATLKVKAVNELADVIRGRLPDFVEACAAVARGESHAEDSMEGEVGPTRRLLDTEREGRTHRIAITDEHGRQHKGYLIANSLPDGSLGELFIKGFGKEGSTMEGWVNSFAIMLSVGVQFGVELPMLARKFAHTRFPPNGLTDNPAIPECRSVPHYIFEWLAQAYGSPELRAELEEIRES